MKLIVGLGNPGREYEHTRHNAGFDVLDRLADLLNTGISQSKFNALITTVRTGQETILLMKPQTYMNNSGEAVIQAVQFYKIPIQINATINTSRLESPRLTSTLSITT